MTVLLVLSTSSPAPPSKTVKVSGLLSHRDLSRFRLRQPQIRLSGKSLMSPSMHFRPRSRHASMHATYYICLRFLYMHSKYMHAFNIGLCMDASSVTMQCTWKHTHVMHVVRQTGMIECAVRQTRGNTWRSVRQSPSSRRLVNLPPFLNSLSLFYIKTWTHHSSTLNKI